MKIRRELIFKTLDIKLRDSIKLIGFLEKTKRIK